MGYENLTQKLTFYKAFFSPQWKFLIHTFLLCLSAKTTAWNEFSSTMAFAIICLATNQKFNFSKYIFDHMVKNIEDGVKFLKFQRFVQVFLDSQVEGTLKHKEIYVTPSHTKKIFANMKRQGKDFSEYKKKSKKSKKKITEVPQLSESTHDVVDEHVTTTSNDPLLSANQALEIRSLKRRVKNLEKKASKKTYKLKRLYKIGSSTRVESSKDEGSGDQEDASKQGRMITDLDANKGVALEVSTADPVPTDGEVVTTAGVEEKGIVIQEPSETPIPTLKDISQQSSKDKDKGKAKMIELEKPLKRKDQIMIDDEVARNIETQMQAELEKEERLARQKEEEDNISLIES
nr:hypothetical protein [Tanacetum cinerariifolium]